MKTAKPVFAVLLVILVLLLLFVSASIQYSSLQLGIARRQGIYPSPEEGVRARAQIYYRDVKNIEFAYAGSNSFDGADPHIGYVMYTIYAASRTDGTPLLYATNERGGNFYLHLKDGWVFMSEACLPEFIGFWMKFSGIAGS